MRLIAVLANPCDVTDYLETSVAIEATDQYIKQSHSRISIDLNDIQVGVAKLVIANSVRSLRTGPLVDILDRFKCVPGTLRPQLVS